MSVKVFVKRVIFVWVFIILLVTLLGRISIAQSNSGRTAADFLTIDVGARAAAMGGAYTALSEGAVSAYWNPAGLARIESGDIILNHFEWLQDVSLEYGAASFRVSDRLVMSASISYLNYGNIDRYDNSGSMLSDEITAYDWAGAISAGISLTDELSFGLTGKYVNQNLDDIKGSALAMDAGLRYEMANVTLAGFVGNFGSNMKFDEVYERLPAMGRLGVAVRPFGSSFTTSVDLVKEFDGDMALKHGLEYGFMGQYFIRSGYNYNMNDEEKSLSGFAFGLGIYLNQAIIDYAYTPSDSYTKDDIHRFSLSWQF